MYANQKSVLVGKPAGNFYMPTGSSADVSESPISWLLALMDPWNHISDIPDEEATAHILKKLYCTEERVVTASEVRVWIPSSTHSQLLAGAPITNAASGLPSVGWDRVIQPDESLGQNYASGRVSSAGLQVVSTTLPSGQFQLNGQFTATKLLDNVNWSNFDATKLTPYNTKDAIQSSSIMDGINAILVPEGPRLFRPFASGSITTTRLSDGVLADYYTFTGAKSAPFNTLTSVIGNANYIVANLTALPNGPGAGFLPGFLRGNIKVKFHFSSLVPLTAGTGAQFLMQANYRNSANAQTPVFSRTWLSMAVPNSTNVTIWTYSETSFYSDFPLESLQFQMTFNASLAAALDYTCQITVSCDDVYERGQSYPIYIVTLNNPASGINISTRAVYNYELTPNLALSKEITGRETVRENVHDFALVKEYFKHNPDARSIWTGPTYQNFLRNKLESSAIRNSIASAGWFSDAWDAIKGVGSRLIRPVTTAVVSTVAPKYVQAVNNGLDSLGVSSDFPRHSIGRCADPEEDAKSGGAGQLLPKSTKGSNGLIEIDLTHPLVPDGTWCLPMYVLKCTNGPDASVNAGFAVSTVENTVIIYDLLNFPPPTMFCLPDCLVVIKPSPSPLITSGGSNVIGKPADDSDFDASLLEETKQAETTPSNAVHGASHYSFQTIIDKYRSLKARNPFKLVDMRDGFNINTFPFLYTPSGSPLEKVAFGFIVYSLEPVSTYFSGLRPVQYSVKGQLRFNDEILTDQSKVRIWGVLQKFIDLNLVGFITVLPLNDVQLLDGMSFSAALFCTIAGVPPTFSISAAAAYDDEQNVTFMPVGNVGEKAQGTLKVGQLLLVSEQQPELQSSASVHQIASGTVPPSGVVRCRDVADVVALLPILERNSRKQALEESHALDLTEGMLLMKFPVNGREMWAAYQRGDERKKQNIRNAFAQKELALKSRSERKMESAPSAVSIMLPGGRVQPLDESFLRSLDKQNMRRMIENPTTKMQEKLTDTQIASLQDSLRRLTTRFGDDMDSWLAHLDTDNDVRKLFTKMIAPLVHLLLPRGPTVNKKKSKKPIAKPRVRGLPGVQENEEEAEFSF